jgi:hypothetical protein
MIRYALVCEHDHDFEGWFRDGATCDVQLADGAVECPYCGSHAVTKALMAPSLVTSRARDERTAGPDTPTPDTPTDTVPPVPEGTPPALPVGVGPKALPVASGPEGKAAMARLARAMADLRAHVENTCEDVGTTFAEEARKIHHGEAEDRPIHGEATLEEAKALTDEGIGVTVLPWSRRATN